MKERIRRLVGLALVNFAILALISLMSTTSEEEKGELNEMDWNTFKHQVLAKGECTSVDIYPRAERAVMHLAPGAIINGVRTDITQYVIRPGNINELENHIRTAESSLGITPSNGVPIIYHHSDGSGELVFFGVMAVIAYLIFRSMRGAATKNPSLTSPTNLFDSFRKANYQLVDKKTGSQTPNIKIKDVAGLHEAKVEVMEFVDYLKRPEAFTKLGAKLPKGALLLGPPGCGKTLLAKAVATETSVPFFAMNGTDFIEMIGGLGAARIRSLFADAKKAAPCIIFIDEIDAIGKQRSGQSRGFPGQGSGEEDQTLNQLLVEMDGMDSGKGVILFAATNRPDILDKAILRPGRFDRHITIDAPTLAERKELFDMYLAKIRLQKDLPVDALAQRMAALTAGMTGADIANVCNEAAIQAVAVKADSISPTHLDNALERIVAGPEKKNRTLSAEEKTRVAYHESGHALVGWMLQHTDALIKVSIIPRTSAALGFAAYNPGDRKLYSKEELDDRMCMALGGRAAENLIFGKTSSGAMDDLSKVTRIAYDQIKVYGMSKILPPMSFPPGPGQDQRSSDLSLKPYSKKLAAVMDQEARELVSQANSRTEQLLHSHKDKLEMIAQELLRKEVLSHDDVRRLIGAPPFAKNFVESVELIFPSPDQIPEP